MTTTEPIKEGGVMLGPIGSIVVGVLAIAVGCFLAVVFNYAAFTQGFVSESWPTVEGKITSSSVAESGPRDHLTFRAHVSYQYEVNETVHRSDRVDFNPTGMSSSKRVHAQEITRKYPVGKQVTIAYDPEDPNISVLEPGVKLGAAFMIGLVCIVTGGLILLSGIISAVRKKTSRLGESS